MELYMRLMASFLLIVIGYLVSRAIEKNNNLFLQVAHSEERLQLALVASNQGWYEVDLPTGTISVGPEYVKMIGYDPVTFHTSLKDWLDSVHPEDREAVIDAFQSCLQQDEAKNMEYRRRNINGEWIWINSIGKVTERDENNHPLRMVGIHTNITHRKLMEEALLEKEEFFRLISECGGDFIAVLDLEGKRIYNNPAYSQYFGNIKAIIGTDSFAEIHPEDRDRIKLIFMDTVNSGVSHRTEFRFLLANGDIRYMESCGGLIKNSRGESTCVVVISHDITDRKKMEGEIHELAFFDPLTKLANRRLFEDRLNQILAASARNGLFGALCFLDLDNFKPVNDTYGHKVGDLLLIEVAERLKKCVRAIDTVARFGGDEFVVTIAELSTDKAESVAQAMSVAEKIQATLSTPFLLTMQHEGVVDTLVRHHCMASIGVTLFFKYEALPEEIIQWADKAMYQAKEAGGNLILYYEPYS
jgi:diguanylate cyclase (GGDEF)-like protein/PAS domain S-box-containing protein